MRAALVVRLVILAVILLNACASGVRMNDEETLACRNEGCAAYTPSEFRAPVNKVLRDGYLRGWVDGVTQGGKGV